MLRTRPFAARASFPTDAVECYLKLMGWLVQFQTASESSPPKTAAGHGAHGAPAKFSDSNPEK